jgi:hypothetical protein
MEQVHEVLDLNGISITQDEEIHALPIYSMKVGHFNLPWKIGEAYILYLFLRNCYFWYS